MLTRGPQFGRSMLTAMSGPISPMIEARRPGAGLHVEARGAVHVVPLRLVLAVAVEHLDAVVLAVGDIDPAVGVAADVMGDVELAGVGAGLAPRDHAACRPGVYLWTRELP